jgi:DNA-binding NtrC family response regulator
VATAEGEQLSSILEEGITSLLNVVVVNSAYELSAIIEGFQPDVVVLDSALGTGPALELANQIKADSRLERVHVFLATGPGEVPQPCREGEIGHLEKPIALGQIEQCLRKSVEPVSRRETGGPGNGPIRSRRSATPES